MNDYTYVSPYSGAIFTRIPGAGIVYHDNEPVYEYLEPLQPGETVTYDRMY